MGLGAQLGTARRHNFGSFDLDIDGARAALDSELKDSQLIVDAAVEPAVVLVAAARGENGAVRMLAQKRGNRFGPRGGIGQIIDAEFQKILAGIRFATGLFEQPRNVGKSECDADFRKRTPLCHSGNQNIIVPFEGRSARRESVGFAARRPHWHACKVLGRCQRHRPMQQKVLSGIVVRVVAVISPAGSTEIKSSLAFHLLFAYDNVKWH